MADIHLTGRDESDVDALRQLKLLGAAVAEGADPGPRGHPLRALAASLSLLSADLQHATEDMRHCLDVRVGCGLAVRGLADIDARAARMQDLPKALSGIATSHPDASSRTT